MAQLLFEMDDDELENLRDTYDYDLSAWAHDRLKPCEMTGKMGRVELSGEPDVRDFSISCFTEWGAYVAKEAEIQYAVSRGGFA
jgi:hypothetical protein